MKAHPFVSPERKESVTVNNGTNTATTSITCVEISRRAARVGRYQLHLWIGEKDYAFLRDLASQEEEPMARIIRRLIRQLRTGVK